MKVEFEHSDGHRSIIGEANNKNEAWGIINKFLADHNFHAPYFRTALYQDEKRVWIDASSHTEFFHVTDMTNDQMKEWML